MKIQFLGTGAAEGVPAIYCKCATCEEVRKRGEREYHTRSQCVIDDKIGIDFPPDAYYHSLKFGVDLAKIDSLLITHSHMDHFYAHDFILRGYKYSSPIDNVLHIYGNAEVKKVFDECTKREMREEVNANIQVHEISPFQPFEMENGYTVTALLAQHSNKEQAYLYLLEGNGKAYLHLTDTGRLPIATLEYLERHFKGKQPIDCVTFDCTFLFRTAGEISRHMGLEDNKAMQVELVRRGVAGDDTKYVITHYSHNNSPLSERLKEAEEKYGYKAAFDGMTLKI